MDIAELAKLMGVKESDVNAFVECLRVWVNKGMTIEQAIEKHMAQMARLANNAAKIAVDSDIRESVASEIWDACHA